MIVEYFKTATQRHIEDDYVISEFGGCVNCQTSNAKRLSSLGLCDDLIVANAKTLSEDPVNFLWLVKQLTNNGVCIHFVEEHCVLRGSSCASTNTIIKNLLSLVSGLPSSRRYDKEPSCMVEYGCSGRRGPYGRDRMVRDGTSKAQSFNSLGKTHHPDSDQYIKSRFARKHKRGVQ